MENSEFSADAAAIKERLFPDDECPIRRYHVEDSNDEIRRLEKARAEAAKKLEAAFSEAAESGDDERAERISAQLEFLSDPAVTEQAYDAVSDDMINAETALAQLCDKFIWSLAEGGGNEREICAAHSASELIIRILLGKEL